MKNLRVPLKLFFLFTLLILVVACGGSSTKNYIVTAQPIGVASFDPIKGTDVGSIKKFKHIYNTLFIFDSSMKIIPELAEGYEQTDPLTYTIYLKKNVKFHNEDIMTASDVKFSLDRMKEAPELNFLTKEIASVNIVDDNTITIKTVEPSGSLLFNLAHPSSSILNEEYVKKNKVNYDELPIGTGPFMFESMIPGKEIKFKRFNDYFKGAPTSEGLVIKIVPEEKDRIKMLEENEVDYVLNLTPIGKKELEKQKNILINEEPSYSMGFLMLNNRIKPFNIKEVRQAIAYALDINEISNKIYMGELSVADSPINPNIYGYKKVKSYAEKDNERAKELLAKAGYPNGFKMKLMTNTYMSGDKMALLAKQQLKEVGIDVEIIYLSLAEMRDKADSADYESVFYNHTTQTGNAESTISELFATSSFGPAGNRTYYSNSQVDSLLDKVHTISDENEKLAIYGKIQDIIQDDVPLIPLGTIKASGAVAKKTKNFNLEEVGYDYLGKGKK